MKQLFIFFLLVTFATSSAQQPTSDKIETSNGPLFVRPVFHGCLVLTWNNKTIYVDPYGGQKAFAGIKSPDLILITDIHADHLNMETLNALETSGAKFIVPQAVADQLPANLLSKATVVANGKNITEQEISIYAIPMYNLPEDNESRHTKGRGNGYLLSFGGKNIYISGDTEDIPEMRSLRNIDVAFICMNLPFTMDINQAASAVLEFKPRIVYPYHYRGKDGLSDTKAFKKLVNDADPKIDVRLRNWYTEYEK